MKNILPKFLSIPIFLICILFIFYLGIRIFKEIGPKSLDQKKMECLKLQTNEAINACIEFVKK